MEIGKEILEEAVAAYKKRENRSFVPASLLSSKQVKNAQTEFARGVSDQEVVALLDTSLLTNGKKGFLLTEKGLYSSEFGSKHIDLAAIKGALPSSGTLKIMYTDGSAEQFNAGKYDIEVASLLITIVKTKALRELEALQKEAEWLNATGGK